MKQTVIHRVIDLLLVAGIAFFSYPIVKEILSARDVGRKIAAFTETAEILRGEGTAVGNLHFTGETGIRMRQDMFAYNKAICENGQIGLQDPFSYEQSVFALEGYGLEDGMIGYLSIPKMDCTLPVYLGASREKLSKGAANLGYTSLPVGGPDSNTVIAAHRGYQGTAFFRDIELLEIGDYVFVTNFWETMTYQVAEMQIILPDDMEKIYIQQNRELLTLITCEPYTAATHRYLVYCERKPAGEETGRSPITHEGIFDWSALSKSQQLIMIEYWVSRIMTLVLLLLVALRFLHRWYMRIRLKRL